MGDAAWFLGQRYDWYTDPNNGNVSCHISQQAMIEGMLENIISNIVQPNAAHIVPVYQSIELIITVSIQYSNND